MWHGYKYVLNHPFRQDGHERLNMDQQLPYFYTLPNRRTFFVAGQFRADFSHIRLFRIRFFKKYAVQNPPKIRKSGV